MQISAITLCLCQARRHYEQVCDGLGLYQVSQCIGNSYSITLSRWNHDHSNAVLRETVTIRVLSVFHHLRETILRVDNENRSCPTLGNAFAVITLLQG